MEGNELQKQETTTPVQNEMITVPKDQLATLIAQNRQAKDERAQLIAMLNGSVEVIAFMKNNILGGSMPTEFSLPQIIKLATKIPKILNNLDEATIEQLKKNMNMITTCAEKFLSEEQIKQISK
jgi:hypothetical protein